LRRRAGVVPLGGTSGMNHTRKRKPGSTTKVLTKTLIRVGMIIFERRAFER